MVTPVAGLIGVSGVMTFVSSPELCDKSPALQPPRRSRWEATDGELFDVGDVVLTVLNVTGDDKSWWCFGDEAGVRIPKLTTIVR